jgi:cytochrome c2
MAASLLFLVLGALPSAAADSAPRRFPDLSLGQELILTRGCAVCHGILGPGRRQGPDLLRVAREKGAPEVLAAMWNHIPQMAGALLEGERLPEFSGSELRDVVGYLNFINFLGDEGNAEQGAAQLAGRQCLGCHDLERRGKIGPALVDPGRSASPVGLITDIWNNYPGMSRALREKGIRWFDWRGEFLTNASGYLGLLASREARTPLLDQPDPQRGAARFARLGCARCHGPNHGAAWVSLTRTLNRRSAAESGAALLRHLPAIEENRGSAPDGAELRPLSEGAMADLLVFLSLAGTDLRGGDPGKGKALFERLSCGKCHALPGQKPGIGPDLKDIPEAAGPYEAAAMMLRHARDMRTATELKDVPWPRMEPDELLDLYAFLSRERGREAKREQ